MVDDGKIMVTGALGQLGKELVALLMEAGYQVSAVDLPEFDLTDSSVVEAHLSSERPQFIFHCAAYTDVERAEEEPERVRQINATSTIVLAECANRFGAPLVYISTDFVFDGEQKKPYTEDIYPNPLSAYGRSKRDGELVVMQSCRKYFIVRTSWLFGRSPAAFPQKILAKASEDAPLKVVHDQRGSPTYARDLAGGLLPLLGSDAYGVYHLANGGTASWYELACETLKLADMGGYPIERVSAAEFTTKAKRPAYSVLDCGKYKETFGVELRHWREALAEYVQS